MMEIGDGRRPRQPGQVRKEAAVTRFTPGRPPVSTFRPALFSTQRLKGFMAEPDDTLDLDAAERDPATPDMFGDAAPVAGARAKTCLLYTSPSPRD